MDKDSKIFDYDITLSFAGEDREYVRKVADNLTELGVKVFYDDYYKADLWGENLFTHLDEIYQNKSKYCVMFLSKNYRDKVWTNHERESAQARAIIEKGSYILPIRLDDTEIPGIRRTIGYIDGNKHTPDEISQLILKKLGLNNEIEELIRYIEDNLLSDYKIKQVGTDLQFISETEDYEGYFPIRLLLEMYRIDMIFEMFILPGLVPH
mgnify:CR=1 FL=1|tara:strand:+ start:801 stop:1427 length:627 start_codon:yes stop_codon:yes gene_type:complete